MFNDVKFVKKLSEIPELSRIKALLDVEKMFPIKCSSYYLGLLDLRNFWEDPLSRIVLPTPGELEDWGDLDPSRESDYTVMEGLQHKYDSTVLALVSPDCFGYCRYCFRKRFFTAGRRPEFVKDIERMMTYIENHREVNNVILSGGDALMLSTPKLRVIIGGLRSIDHVNIIRVGTKATSYFPDRINGDYELLELIKKYSKPGKRIYIMTHFDHPDEITPQAISACSNLIKAGAILLNQTPIIRGVNDSPLVLAELFKRLTAIGVGPYYVFQCRPAIGNKPYAVPIEEGYTIFEKARSMCSGLSKRARFVMSHALGKFEVIALTEEKVVFKVHRASRNRDSSKVIVFKRNPSAYWLDDYGTPEISAALAF